MPLAGLPALYQINSAALLGNGCDSLLAAKLLIDLEDGRKQQVTGMFVVDSGCRGIELDLVLTKLKAEALGLKPFAGPGGQEVTVTARAANRTPMDIVKMWPQVFMLVPLFKHGQGKPAALRKSNLTVWAADIDVVDGSRNGGSEGGSATKAATLNAAGRDSDIWEEMASSSSSSRAESSLYEGILAAEQEYSGDGYQALHSPIVEEKHVALLGFSGLAKLGLKADFAHNMVYSVHMQAAIASVHSI